MYRRIPEYQEDSAEDCQTNHIIPQGKHIKPKAGENG